MSEKEINKEAYKQAEKELFDNKLKEIKSYILETLEKIEAKKKEKSRIDEEMRILKLDLEDLRNGKFDKIEERNQKSPTAKKVSIVIKPMINHFQTDLLYRGPFNNCGLLGVNGSANITNADWNNLTGGTYTIANGTSFYF